MVDVILDKYVALIKYLQGYILYFQDHKFTIPMMELLWKSCKLNSQ